MHDSIDLEAYFNIAFESVGSVRGKKGAMITHLLGTTRDQKRCPHASKQAHAVAHQVPNLLTCIRAINTICAGVGQARSR